MEVWGMTRWVKVGEVYCVNRMLNQRALSLDASVLTTNISSCVSSQLSHGGIIMLKNSKPQEDEDLVEFVQG